MGVFETSITSGIREKPLSSAFEFVCVLIKNICSCRRCEKAMFVQHFYMVSKYLPDISSSAQVENNVCFELLLADKYIRLRLHVEKLSGNIYE